VNTLVLEHPEDFYEPLEAGETILLAFTATFCGPSRVMQSLLDAFADNENFPLTLIEVDVEKWPTITRQYQVKGTPELLIIRDGQPVSSRLGDMSYDQLVDYVASEVVSA
jgi:thioredoxin 1